eukprot:jgi/Mesvir1/26570/Mv16224-RA.1
MSPAEREQYQKDLRDKIEIDKIVKELESGKRRMGYDLDFMYQVNPSKWTPEQHAINRVYNNRRIKEQEERDDARAKEIRFNKLIASADELIKSMEGRNEPTSWRAYAPKKKPRTKPTKPAAASDDIPDALPISQPRPAKKGRKRVRDMTIKERHARMQGFAERIGYIPGTHVTKRGNNYRVPAMKHLKEWMSLNGMKRMPPPCPSTALALARRQAMAQCLRTKPTRGQASYARLRDYANRSGYKPEDGVGTLKGLRSFVKTLPGGRVPPRCPASGKRLEKRRSLGQCLSDVKGARAARRRKRTRKPAAERALVRSAR